jgi:penicillin amidase
MAVGRRRHLSYVAPMRAIAVAAGIIAMAAILWIAWIIRSPLPKMQGTVSVTGLSAETIVRRDDRGIPHIEAATENDAFFGQGYACAQDRLWQMDLLRREAEGDLSELFGSAALSVDTYYRTLGLGEVARSSALAASPADRATLEAYAAGVNAAAFGHELPLEFRLLGYRPAPWTPADSIAVGLLITRSQDDNWLDLLVRADLIKKVGARAAISLTDMQVPELEDFAPGYGPPSASKPSPAADAADVSWADAAGIEFVGRSFHQGSNNWTVAASRTTTGRPVLSNDTHLDHTLPSTWWMSQVEGGGLDAEGFTLPGVPGVIIGHNRRIAFGVTSAAEDVEDLYVERFESSTSDRYRDDGRWVRAIHRKERIAVKGAPDVVLDVLVTRHGPVVKRAGVRAMALAWTILRDGENVSAVEQYDRAGDWREFRAALAGFTGPTLNFVYADVDGNIGYQDAGRVPLRASGDGSVPVEGEDERFAWLGEVPFDRLPHVLNPARGFLATANNEPVPPSFAPVLSRDYLAPYRIHEIVARISESPKQTPQQLGAIQADSFDFPRYALARFAARVLDSSPSAADRRAAAVLDGWDGNATIESTAPTLVAAIEAALEARMLRTKIGADLDTRYSKDHQFLTAVVRTLDGDTSLAPIGVTRATVLAAIVPATHDAELKLDFPAKPLARWGDVNAAVYAHPLGIKWPLTLLNAPTVPQPGDQYAVFQSKPDFGPSERFVADLSDWDRSSMLLTLGESGVWTDPHYQDMEDDWVHVAWSPTSFSDAAVAAAATDTLRLEPAGQP